MAKIFCFIFSLLLTITGFSQKNKVEIAYSYLVSGEIEKAKIEIDSAIVNTSSKKLPVTWYYNGVVYHSIYESKNPEIKSLSSNPLEIAYKSYFKAIELDDENIYVGDIIKRLHIASINFYNKGVNDYNNKDYNNALNSFNCIMEINNNQFINKVDTAIILNIALAAHKSNNIELAKKNYNQLIDYKYGDEKIYLSLAEIYKSENNIDSTLIVYKKGIKQLPKNSNAIVVKLINYFMASGKNDEALEYLKIAIKEDELNSTYHFVQGSIYDHKGSYDNAIISYKQAIRLKPNYFDPNYNLGVIFFNKGIDEIKQADENKLDNEIFQEHKRLAEEKFMLAMPYMETARAINYKHKNTIQTLMVIYFRLGMLEKHDEVKLVLETIP